METLPRPEVLLTIGWGVVNGWLKGGLPRKPHPPFLAPQLHGSRNVMHDIVCSIHEVCAVNNRIC